MKSNIALSYIAMLSIVGFFLWVIRDFVRSLCKKSEISPCLPLSESLSDADKKVVNWPLHIFLSKADDIPIPGRMVSLSLAYAFMESSACLRTGQQITLYVDIPGQEQLRLAAKVIWARASRSGSNAAQLVFENLSADKKKELFVNAV